MSAVISEIIKNSIAEELEFEKGDKILSVNNTKMQDMIDYRFLINAEEIEIEVEKKNGEVEIYEIEKDFDEDLGIVFESAVFDRIKPCTNHCIFCFVDQQPEGLRKTLYIKDDDYRLSFLQGTYVTLTNLTEKDKARIEKLHLGPLYISVHTTNPELRTEMLNNPKAKNILNDLNWLKKADIPVHLQIVLCPGYNDGDELEKTFQDFEKFKSIIQSIAVVPVGITKFHKNSLSLVTKEIAIQTIQTIENFNKKMKKHLAQASDEFFLKANMEIPPRKYYGQFAQIEDGVGAIRLLLDDFEKRKKNLPLELKEKREFCFATSKCAAKAIEKIISELNRIENLSCHVEILENKFFGENVTVAGLITGQDFISQLEGKNYKNIIIPSVMLRQYTNDFLDNVTIEEAEKKLDAKIFVINDFYSTKEIIEITCGC